MLGVEIRRDREKKTLQLSQRSYIDSIISRYGFSDTKPVSIPFDPHTRLSTTQSPTTVEEIAQMRDKPY